MPSAPRRPGREPVVVDLQALQSPTTRDRGIGAFALNWAIALEHHDPALVRAYALNPRLAPPGRIDALLRSGKVRQRGDVDMQGVEMWMTMSPFDLHLELQDVAPAPLSARGVRHGVMVYDLIPALDPAIELADPVERRRYRSRLEVVRNADLALTLSEKVRRDLTTRAGLAPDRAQVVGAAPAAAFVPPDDVEESWGLVRAALSAEGLRGSYVLAVSGSHPRKNNEALIRAFCALSDNASSSHQLVLTGEYDAPTINHYRHLATLADKEGAIVVAGFQPPDVLVALTQCADLAIVAALAEGYGLPIVEAQAAGTRVIASDIEPFDELLDDADRFDPSDEHAITNAIALALGGHERVPSPDSPHVNSWSDVASSSLAALEGGLARRPRRVAATKVLRHRRPRLAVVTPLPPAPSGVAGYSYSLIDALLRTEKVDVEVFCEEGAESPMVPRGATTHQVAAFELVEGLCGRFDHVVYALGNSHHHLGALQLLRRRAGVVLAHDVRLANLYRHLHGDPAMLPGGFEAALQAMYEGEIPPGLGRDGEIDGVEIERFGLLMAREVIERASSYLVNSAFAAALARVDAGVGSTTPIAVLPFAFASARDDAPGFSDVARDAPGALDDMQRGLWAGREPPEGTFIAHFGIVDPSKRPELLLEALAVLHDGGEHTLLCFVGPISDDLCSHLCGRAFGLGVSQRVIFTGPLEPSAYQRWLHAAAVAVQLRSVSNGEASAAVGQCLAAGVPTVVSDLGWAAELPDEAVVKVDTAAPSSELAAVLKQLLHDDTMRRRIATAARLEASRHTFDHTARTLLEMLDRSSVNERGVFTDAATWSPRLESFRPPAGSARLSPR